MHILINMNYIGFYLCYLLQTAKLINVLSNVLTQLFRKVKEVQCNFLWAAGTSWVWGRWSSSCAFKSHAVNWSMFKHLIWINLCEGQNLSFVERDYFYFGLFWVHGLSNTLLRFWFSFQKFGCPHLAQLHFIPADCSFSNANGSSLGLGFLPCQLATGSVGQI